MPAPDLTNADNQSLEDLPEGNARDDQIYFASWGTQEKRDAPGKSTYVLMLGHLLTLL